MKIVLGGSRHLEYIPSEIKERLTEWQESSAEFLVGDAPGTDRAFQQFLKECKIGSVVVYTSADEIRNNLGQWPTRRVESGLKSKSSAVHAFKDREMTKEADLGVMIWDCKSAGTLSNAIDLVRQGKDCLIYVAPESELCRFDHFKDLEKWMSAYPDVRDEALKRLRTFAKREEKRMAESVQPDLFS